MKLIVENKKSLGQRINEAKADIEVKHEGILEVPEGKKVNELPLSHFEKLVDKKGYAKVIRALNNLQVWNKNDDKTLSDWASSTMEKLKKKYRKDESLKEKLSIKDVEFVMNNRSWESGSISDIVRVKKTAPYEYEVKMKDGRVANIEFDSGWDEWVYTINGKGPFSHSSYEYIGSDIRKTLGEDFIEEGLWDVTPLNDNPKVGDKFRSPRGSHEVRAIFKDRKEAEEADGYGYWFTTDDDWDIFAYQGHGYSIGVAPSYRRRMRRPIKEGTSINAKDWDEFLQIAKTIGMKTIQDVDRLHKMYPDLPMIDAIKKYRDEELLNFDESLNESADTTQFMMAYLNSCLKHNDEEEFNKAYKIMLKDKTLSDYEKESIKDWVKKTKFKHVLTEDLEDPKEIEPTPETPENNGLTTILNDLVKSEYDAIDQYNSAIMTAKELDREDIVEILTAIAHDENTHVGNLLVATKLVNPQTQAIDKGEQQAIDTLEGDTVIEGE